MEKSKNDKETHKPPVDTGAGNEPPQPPKSKAEIKESLEFWAEKHNTSCEVLVGIEHLRGWSLATHITEKQFLHAQEAWKTHEAGSAGGVA